MNKIYLEDCKDTMDKIIYDYIFCVPPDYDELNLEPIKDDRIYYQFLENVFYKFKPRKNIITIAITDRKYKGTILPKHIEIIKTMDSFGYNCISQKIWCKSYKMNLYRLNYAFVMSFAKNKYRQNHNERYEEDVWNHKVYKHQGYNYAIALEVVKKCILNFTDEGDIIYDPFMGSGTTAIGCLETSRAYIGSEISKSCYDLAQDRIQKYLHEKKYMLL